MCDLFQSRFLTFEVEACLRFFVKGFLELADGLGFREVFPCLFDLLLQVRKLSLRQLLHLSLVLGPRFGLDALLQNLALVIKLKSFNLLKQILDHSLSICQ